MKFPRATRPPGDARGVRLNCDDGGCEGTVIEVGKDTYQMSTVRETRRARRRARGGDGGGGRAGHPPENDQSVGYGDRFDQGPGPGFTGGELLIGLAAAQFAGEDFLVGLDRRRDDGVRQVLTPVARLSWTIAAGLARKFAEGQFRAVETGTFGNPRTRGDTRVLVLPRNPKPHRKDQQSQEEVNSPPIRGFGSEDCRSEEQSVAKTAVTRRGSVYSRSIVPDHQVTSAPLMTVDV